MYEEFKKFLKAYQPKEVIIQEGESQDDFFCLLQGKLGVWKGAVDTEQGQIKIGEITEKGTYFGEMSCLLKEHRSATITALDEPVKTLKFPGEMLPDMILNQSQLGLKLCTQLANRLKGTTDQHQDVSLQRNEIRTDATAQFLYAKQSFQKVFILLTAIQAQVQNRFVKAAVQFMTTNKLLQGGKKTRIDKDFLQDVPPELHDLVKKAYTDLL